MGKSTYSEADLERGLQALALYGSAAEAERVLAADGGRIAERTLREWRYKHAARLAEIRREVLPLLRSRIAAGHEDLALKILDKQAAIVDRIDADQLPPKDAPRAVQHLAVAGGIHADKASVLRGMPDSIAVSMTAEDILDKLEQADPRYVVDADAFEITDPPALPAAGSAT